MSTRFLEMQKTLRSRWRPNWIGGPAFGKVRAAMDTSLAAVAGLSAKSDELDKSGRFSRQGLAEEVRFIAAQETVPALKKAFQSVEQVKAENVRSRSRLAMPKADSNDVAAAMLRGEMRVWLKSLPAAQAMQHLLAEDVDERLLLAAMETPPEMIGLTHHVRSQLEVHLLTKRHCTQYAELNDIDEALATAHAAIDIALYQLKSEAGFGENETAAFDAWMMKVSGDIDSPLAGSGVDRIQEPAWNRIDAENSGIGVKEFVDELFAEALPQMYPDHPSNRK